MSAGRTHGLSGAQPVSLVHFWHPRYWPVWFGLAVLRVACLLPIRMQQALGRGLGRLMHRVLRRRREIAARNIEICFPSLDARACAELVRTHFESLGIWVFEMGLATWASDKRIAGMTRIEGLEHIQAGLDKGRGVIAVSGHLTTTEISARAMAQVAPPFAAMFRPSKNPFFAEIVRRARGRSTSVLISKNALRVMLRCLEANMPVWYAADQSMGRKSATLTSFFGEPAMTSTAIRDIARISGAHVVGYYPRRHDDGSGYTIEIRPLPAAFPTDDCDADMRQLTAMLEAAIEKAPAQYYWVHRRFKGRPAPLPDPYGNQSGRQPEADA